MKPHAHTMELVQVLEDGSEGWLCLTCFRQLRITWHPFRKKVVHQGDETVNHAGGKGILIKSIVMEDKA